MKVQYLYDMHYSDPINIVLTSILIRISKNIFLLKVEQTEAMCFKNSQFQKLLITSPKFRKFYLNLEHPYINPFLTAYTKICKGSANDMHCKYSSCFLKTGTFYFYQNDQNSLSHFKQNLNNFHL